MLYCLFTSSCENTPRDFEHQHQCCNSCRNKSCPNRCCDDHKNCRLAADKSWIDSNVNKNSITQVESKPAVVHGVKAKVEQDDEAFIKAQAELREKELAKKEARRRRREARKEKAKS